MRVKTVVLENIRSHVKSMVNFEKGFNCLVGGLGTGKSSILYAIDFALFGDPIGRSYEYLLREGADIGKVALKFVQNGKEYTIIRALRRRNNRISQDMEQLRFFEGEKCIASHKNEAVAEQLKAITGFDKDIFRELVWVRQEHLKELLDMRPRERQKRLDELFGLSDYEEAWKSLGEIKRDYKKEKEILEKDYDVVAIKELEQEYDKSVRELAEIEEELQNLRRELVEKEASLNQIEEKLKSLEEQQRQVEEVNREKAELQANIASLEDTCARIAEQIEEKKNYLEELQREFYNLENEEKTWRKNLENSGIDPNLSLEELDNYVSTLNNQISQIRGEQEAARREMQKARQRWSTLTAQSICPLCLQPLTGEYKQSLLQRMNEENAERQTRISTLQKELEELQNLGKTVETTISNIKIILYKKENLKKQIEREKEALNKLSYDFNEKQRLEEELRAKLEKLKSEKIEFDYNELQRVRQLRDEVYNEFSELRNRLSFLESRKGDVGKKIDDFKKRIEGAQEKIKKLEKSTEILEIIDNIRDGYRNIQPKLRREFVRTLERFVQHILDTLTGNETTFLQVKIDESYSPIVISESHQREVTNLSGGERTLLAFAYRLGIGQLIMQSKTGHGLRLLILDEPTESLGREDGSIDRLAEAISRLKTIEQIIAVTHSEAFAEKAEHVIRLEKEDNVSRVTAEEKPLAMLEQP
ncbi:SMC family ATPase [Candidatus Bathyarchaeota archaeon]|nr:SMC family ATPase [Candidatus Bathyarchaeota archaeon]